MDYSLSMADALLLYCIRLSAEAEAMFIVNCFKHAPAKKLSEALSKYRQGPVVVRQKTVFLCLEHVQCNVHARLCVSIPMVAIRASHSSMPLGN